jgi:hypothetical protein
MITRQDAVVLASRTLATLLLVWALTEVSHLPGAVQEFLHSVNSESSAPGMQYLRHFYLIVLGFTLTRIVGFSLMAKWLYKGGPEIEGPLLPEPEGSVPAN